MAESRGLTGTMGSADGRHLVAEVQQPGLDDAGARVRKARPDRIVQHNRLFVQPRAQHSEPHRLRLDDAGRHTRACTCAWLV